MDFPPKDIISGVFTKEFAADVLAYGLILGIPPLLSFVIIVYAIGGGNLGDDCDNGADNSCNIVYKARGTVFVSHRAHSNSCIRNEGFPPIDVSNAFTPQ